MRTALWLWAAGSLALAGAAAAQAPSPKPLDVQTAPPMPTTATPGSGITPAQRGRNTFIAPVMNIQIKEEGVNLPAGVVEPFEPIKPPAGQPTAAPEKATGK